MQMLNGDSEVGMVIASMLGRFELASIAELCEAVRTHADPKVRLAAAASEASPAILLNRLAQDAAPDVAFAARRTLAARFR
jgi:hypothetical protein